MELGIYHEFPVLPGRSQAECFAAGFDIVDASEEYGLDVMWLAELHFDKRRALAASPLVLGTAIAARTERIRIGTSVQVLPLANPLRIAEEAATLDHVSKGRLIFGVGRSGVVKTYEALNIAYSESKDREIEYLEIIRRAWREDNFSYKGKFYDIQDVTVVPQPVQQPTPEIRIAAVSVETFPAAGNAGQGLFLSVRHEERSQASPRRSRPADVTNSDGTDRTLRAALRSPRKVATRLMAPGLALASVKN